MGAQRAQECRGRQWWAKWCPRSCTLKQALRFDHNAGAHPTLMSSIAYPFIPKSTKTLVPGQFWAVPLPDGRFACGRVITLRPKEDGKVDLRQFLAGLLDWVGTQPPTSESIAGRRTLEQGGAHIKTILATGGSILGHRPLASDGIEPALFLSHSAGPGISLQRGFEFLRPATASEQAELPTFITWGYMVIQRAAERHFGQAT